MLLTNQLKDVESWASKGNVSAVYEAKAAKALNVL